MNWQTFWNTAPQVRDPDFCRQVGRTFRQASCSGAQFENAVERIFWLLDPSPSKTLLDLACGNGMVTSRLAPRFEHVTAVDFSAPLIQTARRHFQESNIEYVLGDALEVDVARERYDRVLVCAALQHFNEEQGRRLFSRVKRLVGPGGRVVLADVADRDRIWNFYSGVAGRLRYVAGLLSGRPIIGHWWAPRDLEQIAVEMGWTFSVHYQPPELPNHYFRYDAVLESP